MSRSFALALAFASGNARADVTVGSYGRVTAASDLRGGAGRGSNVVAHGPRLEEPSYLELNVAWGLGGPAGTSPRATTVLTLALFGDFFHSTGQPDAIAVRNAYVEARDLFPWNVRLWAGSRMYRGDDVYLLDYWPLDNLNTVGGGAIAPLGDATELALHVGLSRRHDPFQIQQLDVPSPSGGAQTIDVLDRQRRVASAKLTRVARFGGVGAKLKLYAEAHHLPSGTEYVQDVPDTVPRAQPLPDDAGWLLGAQLGAWESSPGPGAFANVWARYATGLAAYGDNAIPFGLGADKRATGAREWVLAAAANWESARLGVLAGGTARWFHDADRNEYDRDDLLEYAVAVRPHVYVTRAFAQAFEASAQERVPRGASPVTFAAESPRVVKLSVLPIFTPLGPGTMTRPHIRVIYTASFRNAAAQHLIAAQDPRHGRSIEHFLGVGAEWWFDSSYR